MSIAQHSVDNKVLVNMLMIVVFILGIMTIIEIPKEESPAVDFGAAIIMVYYPGVSPAEMEQLVVKKIEDQIQNVKNIDYMTSSSQEGRATVYVTFEPNADPDECWTDINEEMNKVTDLPEDALDPVLVRLNMREVNAICDVALSGDFSGNTIRDITENLQDEILNIKNISKVEINGTRERQIWIESDISKLNQYGISLDEISSAIKTRNMNVPGGTVKFGRAEFIIRTMGEFKNVDEIVNLNVRMDSNGRSIKLSEVATIKDTLQEQTVISKLNGRQSTSLSIFKKEEGNIIDVMKEVREKVAEYEKTVPGLKAQVRNDGSIDVNNSINTLGSNAMSGVILVFIVLWIFIGWRNAILAAWGIPFSFMLTFVFLRFTNITMNNMSLFALVLVTGMIVDNAIVIIENVYRYVEMGKSLQEAVITGTNEVMWPIFASTLTTIAAFMPILLTEGIMGKFIAVFPIVVTTALLASLVESIVILPAHIVQFTKELSGETKRSEHFYANIEKKYRKALRFVLCHRAQAIGIIFVMLIFSLAVLAFGWVRFEFFPARPAKTLVLKLQTPVGTNLDKTNEMVSKVENYILTMPEKEDVEAIVTDVGQMRLNNQREQATSNAELRIDLKEIEDMKYGHEKIKKSIREYLDKLPELYSYRFSEGRQGPPTGQDVEIRIKGDNLERLEYIGEIIKTELSRLPGVSDIEDSFKPGKKEIRIIPKEDKLSLYGLSIAQVASLVRTASYGSTVSIYRGMGLDENDIILRVREEQINDMEDLKYLRIRTKSGSLVQLSEVADFDLTTGLALIEHRDRKRIITITGNNSFYEENGKRKKRTSGEVVTYLVGNKFGSEKGVLSNFEQRFPGYQIEFGGVVEQQNQSYRSLFRALIVALLLIFTILAAQFKSYVQPLVVMITIPFGFIGVILGLLITRLPFSMNTVISFVALSGVVVNAALILVDFINKEREKGVDRWHSLINAGATRLRPIN
ncbi:MAG: efflux RND transporter permease subunit [Candidatus Cloacimonetes bacterium]|nr:efflux RND transporter permease subunit [Candidatus Cloacimonadota bacterium]